MKTSVITENERPVAATRKKRRVVRKTLLVLAILLVALLLFSLISPLPVSMLMRIAFRNGDAVEPDNYELMESQVITTKDLTYPSSYKSNSADIYRPKDITGKLPVVLWVHGGAYVGGDKRNVGIYATALAAEGFAVVCINYQRAPEAKYPVPVIQTGEAYLWLCEIAEEYSLDMERIILAGDSAGAQIVAQFAAIQSNSAYSSEIEMEQLVSLNTIKSVLLFCGPFDSEKISLGENPFVNFCLSRAAWAYFGSRDWAERFAQRASVGHHITDQYPPTFISDGNTASFEYHGRDLAEILDENNVLVETYFINPDDEKTYHEYQFVMNTPAGRESFKRTLNFMKRHLD